MTTKTVNLYTFDELSETAKEKARDWWRECESADFGAHGELFESAQTAAKLLGIEFKGHEVKLMGGGKRSEPNIYWQIDGQGYGACFEATYSYARNSVKAVSREFPGDQELQHISAVLAKFQKRHRYGAYATVSTTGRSSHGYSMRIEAYDANGNQLNDDDETQLLDFMRLFATWIYEGIRQEYDYRMSDECVDDSIVANEYTFLENGKRED